VEAVAVLHEREYSVLATRIERELAVKKSELRKAGRRVAVSRPGRCRAAANFPDPEKKSKNKIRVAAVPRKNDRTRSAALMLSRSSNPWQDKAEFCSVQVDFG
jgi:hypothetical protein